MKKKLKEYTFEIDNFQKGHNNKMFITIVDYNMAGVRQQLMKKFGEVITFDILDGYYDDRLDTEEKV